MSAGDDAYWAAFFGIVPGQWNTPGISYRPHRGLRGYQGLWTFRRLDRVVVSVPPAWVAHIETRWVGWERARLMDRVELVSSLSDACEQCIGPAFHGCLDPAALHDIENRHVRALDGSDRPAVGRFRERCGADAWGDSGLDGVETGAYAYLEGAEVTAMAGVRVRDATVADVCVLTDPQFRGEGRGSAVVRAAARHALADGKLVMYQTLASNRPAVGLALSVGFERYANHVAVRLARPAP